MGNSLGIVVGGSSLRPDGKAVWVQTPSTRMDAGVLRRCGASPCASVPTAPQLRPVGGILPSPTGCAHHPPGGAPLPTLSEEPLANRPLGVEHLLCSEAEPSRFQPRLEPISEPPQPRRESAHWAPDGNAAFETVPRAGSPQRMDGRHPALPPVFEPPQSGCWEVARNAPVLVAN
ncbi:hypothetical protein D623_10014230 [Myotis brandtii]|uniref:Uncharacterized protein n=1 Tax=Myotis brandtii TaxID=109478 RepID=S7Q3L4_MYOBR|nr:hypothetical protein D623_10014230 [Myotis brandtii]